MKIKIGERITWSDTLLLFYNKTNTGFEMSSYVSESKFPHYTKVKMIAATSNLLKELLTRE